MKKNIFIMMLLLIFAISLFSGCTKVPETLPKPEDIEQKKDSYEDDNQGIIVNQIEYEVVDINTLPDQLLNDIELLKLNKGYEYWQQEDGSYLILISAGEKATGGYAIEVRSIEDNEGQTIISIIETEPSANDIVTLAITYPYVVVKAIGITDQFIVRDQNQNEYKRMGLDDVSQDNSGAAGGTMLNIDENPIDFSKPIVGVYQGRIDNNSIEAKVGETFMAFFSYELDQYLENIEEGDTIEITVSISPSDQLIVEDIVEIQ